MITSAMVLKLYEVYLTKDSKGTDISRKDAKVIIDSIIEQLCDYYFSSKPTGVMNIRQTITERIESFSEEDKKVLKSFNLVLREYNDVFTKKYSNHDTGFSRFLENELRDICRSLSDHSIFRDDENATKLRGVLS